MVIKIRIKIKGGRGVFGGVEVLQCYNPHKTEGFCTMRCYKGATEVLQVLQKEKRKSQN